jgi:hypothetical protein
MAPAVATLDIAEPALAHGVKPRQSGPPQVPLILFDDDPRYEKGIAFCAAALQRGMYLHPRHNMFRCLAHGENEVDRTLEATEGEFVSCLVPRRWRPQQACVKRDANQPSRSTARS